MASKSTPLSQLPFPQAQTSGQVPAGSTLPPGHPAHPGQAGHPTHPAQVAAGCYVNDQHRHIVTQAQQAAQNYTLPQSSTQDMSAMRDADPTVQEAFNNYMSGSQIDGAPAAGATSPTGGMAAPSAPQFDYFVQPAAAGSAAATGLAAAMPNTVEIRLAVTVTAAFILINALPCADWLSRRLPQVFDQVPNGDVVIKAVLLGILVLIAARWLTRPSERLVTGPFETSAYGPYTTAHGMQPGMMMPPGINPPVYG
jgi:hypothetical protein